MFRFIVNKDANLTEIIRQLNKEYFDEIEAHCNKATDYAFKLKVDALTGKTGNSSTTDIYVNMCLGFLQDVKLSINERRDNIIPYLNELAEKVNTGHDCSQCSTGCTIKHNNKVPFIQASQVRTKEMLTTLERIAVPVYDNISDSELYELLRKEMVIIQTAVIEMFYIEESVLIPKILEEQKTIHVRR